MTQTSTSKSTTKEREVPKGIFVQFVMLKVDREWRRLPLEVRQSDREEFVRAMEETDSSISTFSYSTVAIRSDADIMLWRMCPDIEPLQESLSRLLKTGIGRYIEVSHVFIGMTKPSVYTRARTAQEQAIDIEERLKYYVLYPFTKTSDWYLLSKEVRQGMMNEHIRVGRSFPSIRQILVYSTGLGDQEFIVGYETDDLAEFQDLVIALRATEARRYTLQDTPIFTCVYRPLDETLELLG
jgi:chlorite dismutase